MGKDGRGYLLLVGFGMEIEVSIDERLAILRLGIRYIGSKLEFHPE